MNKRKVLCLGFSPKYDKKRFIVLTEDHVISMRHDLGYSPRWPRTVRDLQPYPMLRIMRGKIPYFTT